MRSFLVEVFTVIKVNLDLFKGKIAGKRATLRASGQLCGQAGNSAGKILP